MYRSASTLQFQIATRLVQDAGIGQQVGWIDAKRFSEVRDSYTTYSDFKVIKVHLYTDLMISEFRQNNALGIYTFRDIRDVYASYMKQQQKSFDYFWNAGLIEDCLDNYKKWTSLPNMLVSTYEKIIEDLPKEVQRIAEHLNIQIEPSQFEHPA